MMKETFKSKVTVLGVGKLGLCWALNLARSGYKVKGVDVSEEYVNSLNNKTFVSSEEHVTELLQNDTNFSATTNLLDGLEYSNTIFVLVATPSLDNGKYDHSQVLNVVEELKGYGRQADTKHLIIGCTVMPGFCQELQKDLESYNYKVSYNPEFIAQGTIIRDQLQPDMVLIGAPDEDCADEIKQIHHHLAEVNPHYAIMSPLSAEICKISLNCFITTKIAFTNMIGDLATEVGAEPQKILDAIGADTRVGSKCTMYGFGYGGPCFPRDNRALGIYAKEKNCPIDISDATDACNDKHLDYMVSRASDKAYVFDCVTYKPQSTMIEESQQLAYAVRVARGGAHVTIKERQEVVDQVKELYGELFTYEIRD